MSAAKITAQNLINENGVVVFSKSYCPYCKASKDLLNELGAKYTTLELDEERELPIRVYVHVVPFLPCCRMYIISENTSQYPKIPLHRIDRNFYPNYPALSSSELPFRHIPCLYSIPLVQKSNY